MGKVDANATQYTYHQGLDHEFAEPIDDNDKQKKPQQFPPQVEEEEEEPAQVFPPPPNQHHDHQTHAFPPIEEVEISADHQHFAHQNAHFQQNANFFSPQPINTTTVNNKPPTPPPVINVPDQIPSPEWKTHLFGCMDNPSNAIMTLLFPCVTFGQIAEILDSGRTSCGTSAMLYVLISCCTVVPCLITCGYRGKMRARFGLMETPAPDCILHCFCEYCALCQEYRELEERGIDPSIGYYGNVAKQKQQQQQQLLAMGMAAPTQQRMI